MNLIYNIEQTILVSVLESDYIQNEPLIKEVKLNPNFFTDPFHKLLVKGINRLKELDLPIETDFLREQFVKNNQWGYERDNYLMLIMEHTPLGTLKLFNKYLKVLEDNYMISFDRRLAI